MYSENYKNESALLF